MEYLLGRLIVDSLTVFVDAESWEAVEWTASLDAGG